jgi:selenocysteine-specific elongation factor
MIVGTAGHIDHGKTTLTCALTGVDTDRLKEEKARGISIELGYAYAPLASGDTLGVIDVPGHEKFIRAMASGVTGIDYALLVIAADDGIMPQTMQHLCILKGLGVPRGGVVLTHTARADADRTDQVEYDIGALLSGTPFDGAPVFRTAATQPGDPGVAALLAHLSEVSRTLPARDDRRLFRLGVDRVFTLTGQGTVVTGTALAGRVDVGDTLVLAPGAQEVRVRGIHAQNRKMEHGLAGQRLALNLAGVAKEDIERGSWVVAPAMSECSPRFEARLSLAAGALKAWSPVHVHLGASHHTAHVVPLDMESVLPGRSARVQLVFDTLIHAVPGDRFVIRNAQATQTIGGGIVLDPFGAVRKRRSPARLAWLDAMQAFVDSGNIATLLAQSPLGVHAAALVRLTQLPASAIALPTGCLRLSLPGGDELWIAGPALAALERSVFEALSDFHARHPDDAGVELWRLKRIAQPDADDATWSALVAHMLAANTIGQRGNCLHLPNHSVELTQEEQAQAAPLLAALEHGRFDPPWVRDLSSAGPVPEDEVRRLLRKLARAGQVAQVVPDLFYHPRPLAELARIIATLPDTQAATFRDATGQGRKRAIQVLEYFDRVGYTRRVRNSHMVRPNAHWPDPG